MTWEKKVDWTKPNAQLARELGLSRQRIHQKRKQLGLEPVNPKGGVEENIRKWLKRNNPKLYSIRAIARAVGCSPSAVMRYRDLYGLE